LGASLQQEDFDSFEDVDDTYQSLPLDKIEALENLEAIPNVAPSIVVKEKVSTSGSCTEENEGPQCFVLFATKVYILLKETAFEMQHLDLALKREALSLQNCHKLSKVTSGN